MTAGIPFSFVVNTFGMPISWWGMVTAATMAAMLVQLFLLALNLKPKKTTRLGDLPDLILVEILARLACKSTLFRAKCVSKRWLSLLSDPYFVRTFLSVQGVDEGNAFIGAGILFVLPYPNNNNNNLQPELKVVAHPVVKTRESQYFSLDFLPCIQQEKERHVHLELMATYNDLVLCCKTYTIYDDEDYLIHNPYYICNPYTKKWLALPPGNHLRVPSSCTTYVGFICEPYFKQQHSEQASSKITLNAEYRWSVVQRLIPLEPSMHELRMDIFSSETRQWRPLVVQCPPSIPHFCCGTEVAAYNGKLYRLLGYNNTMVELDPTECRLGINNGLVSRLVMYFGVCRGRLRMCERDISDNRDYVGNRHLSVWEWKEEVHGNGHEWCLVVDSLSMNDLVLKYPLVSENKLRYRRGFRVLSFHPYNEDVVFLGTNNPNCIALCNMRQRTLEIFDPDSAMNFERWYLGTRCVYPFVIPWLPTPVPVL